MGRKVLYQSSAAFANPDGFLDRNALPTIFSHLLIKNMRVDNVLSYDIIGVFGIDNPCLKV